jgi:chromosome segregation ATPase
MGSVTDEARRATQVMQEREKELTALRSEMAATRIAAAKQEAELYELRMTVSRLRQDNNDSQQALLETKRMLESRQTELAAMKMERDQLAQATAQSFTGSSGNGVGR